MTKQTEYPSIPGQAVTSHGMLGIITAGLHTTGAKAGRVEVMWCGAPIPWTERPEGLTPVTLTIAKDTK